MYWGGGMCVWCFRALVHESPWFGHIIPPSFVNRDLFVFRARGIADRLHAGDIGIRDIRQVFDVRPV